MKLKIATLTAVLACSVFNLHGVVIEANFSGGNGTSSSDQFVGTAGNGWVNAWQSQTNGTAIANSGTVTTGLFGPSNYLRDTVTRDPSGAAGRSAGVTRSFSLDSGAGGINTSANYTISFDWRMNSSASSNWTLDTNHYFYFFGSDVQTSSISSTVADSFRVWTRGTAFRATNNAGGDAAISGITLAYDTTYSITLTLTPTAWDVSIFDGTNTGAVSSRNYSSVDSGIADWLNFTAYGGAAANAAGETLVWGLDNLQISQVPEPATYVLFGLGAAFLACRSRRRA